MIVALGVCFALFQFVTLAMFIKNVVDKRKGAFFTGLLHYGGTFGFYFYCLTEFTEFIEQMAVPMIGGYLIALAVAIIALMVHQSKLALGEV